MFYPESSEELARVISELLAGAHAVPGPCPKALIVPHAGYVYSGAIAAAAFAQITAHAARIRRVILVGPAHREFVDGLAWPDAAKLGTPVGDVEVDVEAIEQLISPTDDAPVVAGLPRIAANARAHAREHCLEVMLPFLRQLVPHAKIVPLIGSRATPEQIGRVLDALWGGAETLIVISSDLSHHLTYDAAATQDAGTAARILALDATLEGSDACGAIGIDGLLWLARQKQLRVEQLDLRNSGDTAGGHDRVVGYGAFAFYEAS